MTSLRRDDILSAVWRACDTFRGAVDATQYKDYVLTALFLKYISDVRLTDVVTAATLVEAVKVGEEAVFFGSVAVLARRNHRNFEPLAIETPLDANLVASIFAPEFLNVFAREARWSVSRD